jgi:hypothetical protein
VVSGIVLPGNRPAYWHESGMGVNPRGELVVSTCNGTRATETMRGPHNVPRAIETLTARKYRPGIYPGRYRYAEIHIFDRHGKPIGMDVAGKGVMDGHGTLIDPAGDVYFLAGARRLYDGKPFHALTGCVVKFKRGKGRFYASNRAEIPLSEERKPDFAPQLLGAPGRIWVEDAEWIYPGAGFAHPSAPCQCWNTRFAVDYFGRVFIPEFIRNQAAVLDTNGNLILHVGKYGNIDDGVPLAASPESEIRSAKSIGGDEVSLVYANYVAVHSDRRLFIADAGNGRIVGVRLDYHATETVPLGEAEAER